MARRRVFASTALSALCLCMLTVLCGCASGPPKPRKLIYQAKKAHRSGDYGTTLRNFEKVLDTTPHVLNRSHYRDEIDLYRDAQIHYGLSEAKRAEAGGRLIDAWVYYAQVSVVDEARDECARAAEEASRLKRAVADDFLARAADAEARRDPHRALVAACQSLWYGGDERAAGIVAQVAHPLAGAGEPWRFSEVRDADVKDLVRTDSLERLRGEKEFAPYGIPIYFGEPPRYYVPMGEVKIEGRHYSQEIPPEYAVLDALAKLTRLARKKGADGIVNVRLLTRRKKAFTLGELVKFAELPPEVSTGVPVVRTRIADGGEPVPSLVAAYSAREDLAELETPQPVAVATPVTEPGAVEESAEQAPALPQEEAGEAPADQVREVVTAPQPEEPPAEPEEAAEETEDGTPVAAAEVDGAAEEGGDEPAARPVSGLGLKKIELAQRYEECTILTFGLAHAPPNLTYVWSVDGEVVLEGAGESTLVHTFSKVGPSTVSLAIKDGDRVVEEIQGKTEVTPVASLAYTVWVDNEFAIDTLPEGYEEYRWEIDGAAVSSERVLKHTFPAPGRHRIDGYASRRHARGEDAATYRHVVYDTTVEHYRNE